MGDSTGTSTFGFKWPSSLARPNQDAKIVYLDLNHWIYLAQADNGSRNGEKFTHSLEACRRAKSDQLVVFPISATHYMELTKIIDPSQRRRVGKIMAELSDFTTLLDRQVIIKLEMESMLDSLVSSPLIPAHTIQLLGNGLGHAFGMKGGFHLRNTEDNSDANESMKREIGADLFNEMIAKINLLGEQQLLFGPEDSDLPELTKLGYIQNAAELGAKDRAEQENLQRERHKDTKYGKGNRLFDVVAAREFALELLDHLNQAILERGITNPGLYFSDKSFLMEALSLMPISYSTVALKTEQHRYYSRPWNSNDIFDIDAMSQTLPYCDVIVTEKQRWNDIRKSKLDQKFDTVVFRRLVDLSGYLESL